MVRPVGRVETRQVSVRTNKTFKIQIPHSLVSVVFYYSLSQSRFHFYYAVVSFFFVFVVCFK